MKKIEIVSNSVVITDTTLGKVLFDAPKSNTYYNLKSLQDTIPYIQLIDTSANNDQAGTFTCKLLDAVDSGLVAFTSATFQDFARLNLGFNEASYTETDPIFGGSEAALFVSGDKAKLDNQTGINTGDETNTSIQTKRPLKTIEGQSLEGVGNVDLTKNDVGLSNVDNTSDVNKPISTATQGSLNTKVNKITSVDNQAVRFDGVAGEVQGSGVTILDNGNVGLGTNNPIYSLDISGVIRSSNANGFRMTQGGYGSFFRNDTSSFQLLFTNNGDPDGIWNSLRPLQIFISSGEVRIAGNAITAQHNGNVGIGTDTPTSKLDVNGNTIRLRTARTPATATSSGNQGDICWDVNFIYVCIALNTWRRIAHSTW